MKLKMLLFTGIYLLQIAAVGLTNVPAMQARCVTALMTKKVTETDVGLSKDGPCKLFFKESSNCSKQLSLWSR
jgi:hypothetical protein